MDNDNKSNTFINRNDKLFYLIWHNQIIRKEIIKYLIYYKIYDNYSLRRYFARYSGFNLSYEKEYLKSIVLLISRTWSKEEFLSFFKQLSNRAINIQSIEFKDSFYFSFGQEYLNKETQFEIKDLLFPKSIKEVKLGNMVFKDETLFNKLFFKNPFEHLVSLDIGYSSKMLHEKFLLNTKIKHLTIRCVIEKQLSKSSSILPQSLTSLSILIDYIEPVINLPNSIKSLKLGALKGFFFINPLILQYLPISIQKLIVFLDHTKPIQKIINYTTINLKKLITTVYFYNNCFLLNNNNRNSINNNNNNNNYSNNNKYPPTLNKLQLYFSHCDYTSDRTIDIDLIPSTITSLKLLSNLIETKSFKVERGYPSSIINFEGHYSNVLNKFQEPNNLRQLLIIDYNNNISNNNNQANDINNNNNDDDSNSIFNKFPNLISIKYLNSSKSKFQFQTSDNLINLEIIEDSHSFSTLNVINYNLPSYKDIDISDIQDIQEGNKRRSLKTNDFLGQVISLDNSFIGSSLGCNSSINTDEAGNSGYRKGIYGNESIQINIKDLKLSSLKLDIEYTTLILEKVFKSPSLSPFPSTLLLLDLEFGHSSSLIFSEPLLDITILPPNLRYIIIRGTDKPLYTLPLPNSIERIFISKCNPIIKDLIFMSTLYSKISIFESLFHEITIKQTSKLYNNLRKII